MSAELEQRIYDRCIAPVADLEAENAKLRELVRDMWKSCPVYTADCWGCEHHRSDGGCKLYDRMRELGIEVEGWASSASSRLTSSGSMT